MPLYFLNVREAARWIEDLEGQEFVDLTEAKIEAVQGARSILAAQLMAGDPLELSLIEICDRRGVLMATVSFRDTFRIQ